MPTPAEHAHISPSGAHRWLACTASPTFEAQFPNGTSVYAEEGTVAHSVCELYARRKFLGLTTRKFNSEMKKLQENELFDEEMIRTAEAYVECLTERSMKYEAAPHIALEAKVDLSEYIPEGFGTCDCIMIGGDTLHITDYKHGRGVPVSAEENPQMMLYALGALKLYSLIYGDVIKNVLMTICQPRIDNISDYGMTVEQLLAWGEAVKPVAKEAYEGPGTFCPGEHCRFCRGKAQCRARADQNTAFEEFKDFALPGQVVPDELKPCLSDEEIGDLLIRAEGLVQWYKDLQDYAMQALLEGKEIPGWKVVAGRSNRAFKDVDAAIKALVENGWDEAILYDRKPKTLTELEKLLGKKPFAEILGDQIVKPQGKPTLAPFSDKREPYNTAASDFAGLEGSE